MTCHNELVPAMSKPKPKDDRVVPLRAVLPNTTPNATANILPFTPPDLAAELAAQSPGPLYAQIRQLLRERILDGTYQPHQQMPSEAEMIAGFGVSRITVRQALADLQNEGLIFRLHGKGSFVSKPKAFQDLGRLQGFGEAMRKHGYESFNRVLSLKTVTPAPSVAERLQLPKRGKATEIRRLRFLNREPISLDITCVPTTIGQRLAKQDLATRDIFVILENDFGLALGHADLQIDSTLADEALAGLLKVEEGAPVLHIERTTHLADGTPIDHEHLYYRGDAFQYKVRVDRVSMTHK
jgi:GntR family transcriptional regulator